MSNKKLYFIHRWISLLALGQLGVWSVSGLFFTLLAERAVMSAPAAGAHDLAIEPPPSLATPESIWARARADHGERALYRIELRSTGKALVYIVRGGDLVTRYDARTARPLPVSRREAELVARRDQEGSPGVASAALVRADPPIEYRGKSLPAWRVVLADEESTAVWVDARSGEVTARRTSTWRTYDFLWSLHIMDYGSRDDFRHPWIIAFALLANLTVLSGVVLWCARVVRAWRRRREPAATISETDGSRRGDAARPRDPVDR